MRLPAATFTEGLPFSADYPQPVRVLRAEEPLTASHYRQGKGRCSHRSALPPSKRSSANRFCAPSVPPAAGGLRGIFSPRRLGDCWTRPRAVSAAQNCAAKLLGTPCPPGKNHSQGFRAPPAPRHAKFLISTESSLTLIFVNLILDSVQPMSASVTRRWRALRGIWLFRRSRRDSLLGCPFPGDGKPGHSSRGKKIAFAAGDPWATELWVMENSLPRIRDAR